MKSGTFQRMISKFADLISPYAYTHLNEYKGSLYLLENLQLAGKIFKRFPQAHQAIDVIFQSLLRPVGSIQEGMKS